MPRIDLSTTPDALLPTGAKGQLLALAVTLLILLTVGFGILIPLHNWYQRGADKLAQAQLTLAHEQALIVALPSMRQQITSLRAQPINQSTLLPGISDAVAGATLQGRIQSIAQSAGISLDSGEILPVVHVGTLNRIPLRVTMTTSYDKLVGLLAAIAASPEKMLVDDVSIHATGVPDPGRDLPVTASFTVSGFRAAASR
jgi:general secretion pathway protein M